MKQSIFLLLLSLAAVNTSFSQKIELINSGEIIKRSEALKDSGAYKIALIELNKISRSDTNYVRALYAKANICEADSQYKKAIKYCEEGLALREQREVEPDLYNSYGNIMSDIGEREKALKIFDTAIKKFPNYWFLYFNKGVVLIALNKYAEAETLFEKTLLINPYMYSAHYQLAVAALGQGKIIPAYLSLVGYLLVNPEGKYYSKTIALLNHIANSADDIIDFKNKRTVGPDANYQAVEEIVLSKIALDKAYKPLIALDDPISRQIQAVFEKLEYNAGDNDFWIQYYLPFYKKIFNEGKFELFINHSFSNVKIPIIQDYNKNKKKELAGFVDEAADYFNLLKSTRELFFTRRDTVKRQYYFKNGGYEGKGMLTNNGKTLSGYWEFYFPAGTLKSMGVYNATGQREGEWTFFFESGKLKSKETSKNGKLEGKQVYYFDNGNLSSIDYYVNGGLQGASTGYYYAGNLRSAVNYNLGKKDGQEQKYYANGNLQSVFTYTNGVLNGIGKEYYKHNRIKVTEMFSNGKGEGSYKQFYESGALHVEGQNVKDNGQGEWKYYYENGKIKEKRSYLNDFEDGLHTEYYDNGQILFNYNVKKGKITGEEIQYNKDGKIISRYIYENGIAKSAKYFDKAGNQLSTSEAKGDRFDIVSYNSEGRKKAHFGYNKKGDLDGTDSAFFSSGRISEITIYKNGELEGTATSYYLNGNKKTEINMTAGKEDGLYTGYYANGRVENTGWIVNGQKQGTWEAYDEAGRLNSRFYYLDDDLDGYKEEYLPNGQKVYEDKYYRGWLDKITQYDNTGNVIAVDSFPKASGKYVLYYPNHQIMAQGNYVNGDLDGPYKTYFFDGSLESSSFYNKGDRDSTYISYHYSGIKNAEGKYSLGSKTGLWKYFNEDGKITNTNMFANDQLNGETIYYFPNGKKDLISHYKDNLLDGANEKYDPDGTLSYQIIFENGDAKAYAHLEKGGKISSTVPIALINGGLKTYFPNGKLSRECTYYDGVKNGQDILYYTNGQMRSVDTVAYGITNSVSKEYYENGKLKSNYLYSLDNASGTCKDFFENGTLKTEVVFDNGLRTGPAKYYDENGKLVKTMWYIYGTLTAVKNEK